MKKLVTGLFCLVIQCIIVNAQPELYAPVPRGGKYDGGTLLKFLPASNSANAVWNFGVNSSAAYPYGHVTPAWNGKLYGMTSMGGSTNAGMIFSYDPATASYSQVFSFGGSLGENPPGSLVQAKNGKLYGMTYSGGTYGYGVIFSFDPLGGLYSVAYHFDSLSGAHPYGSLVQASDGKLYGMTYGGGFYDGGVLFSFDPATGVYSKLVTLGNFVSAQHPYGSLIQAKDGKLYGMTSDGGGFGFGAIFSYDLAGANYKVVKSFDGTDGVSPRGDLVEAADGKLYGMTSSGGPAGSTSAGTIFSFDPVYGSYSVLKTFTGADGGSPYGSLIQASNGTFFGMALSGGSTNQGVLFSFVPIGAGGGYSPLWSFNGTNGARPFGSLYLGPDGKLYGMTSQGGSFNGGVLFAMTPLKGPYAVLKNFDGSSSFDPGSRLVQANDGKIYGMTNFGGPWNTGMIYSYDPATGMYSEKASFGQFGRGSNNGGLVQASDGKLYGVVDNGGVLGDGSIISYDPSSGVISTLKYFDGISGSSPSANLIQASDGKLYGVTFWGGSHGVGVLYSFDPVSGAYAVLKNFDMVNGHGPQADCSLVQASDGKLYGVLRTGGTIGNGEIFSYDPIGAAFLTVKSFYGWDGSFPTGGLIQASDGRLYGVTAAGGSVGQGNGVLYSFDPFTSAYSVVWNFVEYTNVPSAGSLLQASDGKLYGMTDGGGANQLGTVFSWDPGNATFATLADLSVSTGNNPWDDDQFLELRNIKTLVVPGKGYCRSAVVRVPFQAGGVYNRGNIFTAQLSDSTGNFAKPILIGRAVSRFVNGTINATIPANIPAGKRYRIRVVSTSPVVYGADNGSDILIIAPTSILIQPANAVGIVGQNASFAVGAGGSDTLSYQWMVNSGAGWTPITDGGIYAGATTPNLMLTGLSMALNGYQYSCVVTGSCGVATSNPATLSVSQRVAAGVKPSNGVAIGKTLDCAFSVTVYPNPSNDQFTLVLSSSSDKPMYARVMDLLGRVIEVKSDLPARGTWKCGASYLPGLYLCELVQGDDRVIVKLIKTLDR